jgi:hypothetical protein
VRSVEHVTMSDFRTHVSNPVTPAPWYMSGRCSNAGSRINSERDKEKTWIWLFSKVHARVSSFALMARPLIAAAKYS